MRSPNIVKEHKYILTVQHNIGTGIDAEPSFCQCTGWVKASYRYCAWVANDLLVNNVGVCNAITGVQA